MNSSARAIAAGSGKGVESPIQIRRLRFEQRAAEVLRDDSGGTRLRPSAGGIPSKRMPPRRTRLGGVAPPLKQVASDARSERCRGPGVASSVRAGSSAARTNLWGRMTGTAVYEIRRARTREELAAALALRHDVFCVEQGVPERDELDGRDHEGIHLVAVRDGELLATCRIVLVGSTAQFSRLAVRQSARRQGIATALLGSPTRSRAGAGRDGSCSTPRPTLASCTSRPATARAAGCSGRRGSSTSRWRRPWIERARRLRTQCLRFASTH